MLEGKTLYVAGENLVGESLIIVFFEIDYIVLSLTTLGYHTINPKKISGSLEMFLAGKIPLNNNDALPCAKPFTNILSFVQFLHQFSVNEQYHEERTCYNQF